MGTGKWGIEEGAAEGILREENLEMLLWLPQKGQ